jgi:hypothetical protein
MTARPEAARAPSPPSPTSPALRIAIRRLALGVPPAAALGVAAQWPLFSLEPLLAAVNLAVGLSFLATGVLVSTETGQGRVATALAGAGVLWPMPAAAAWTAGPLPLLATLVGPLAGVLAAWGLLHYPTPWVNKRREKLLLGLLAAVQSLVLAVVLTAEPGWHYLPRDTVWLPAWPNRHLFDTLKIVYHGSHGLLAFCVAAAMPIRIRRLSGPDRHIMTPLALAVAVAALATALSVPFELAGPPNEDPRRTYHVIHGVLLAGIPAAFLVAALRRILSRNAISVLVGRLGSTTDVDVVLPALREALTDPTLEILYWMPDTCYYIDTAGEQRQPPAAVGVHVDDIRADDGQRLALVVADPALRRHPQIAEPAARALALSLANARLHAQIRAQIAHVRHTRRRLPEVVEAERLRIENDIACGAHEQLRALEDHLRDFLDGRTARACAQDGAGTGVGAEHACAQDGGAHDDGAHDDGPERRAVRALREVQAQLPVAQRELRDLARGFAPGLIAEAGLRAAVAPTAENSPLPVLVDLPGDRFDRDTENAAYFMISEAVTNAVKHANASTVLVHGVVVGGRLLISVVDDGDGGADPAGHGLTGIAERIAACGGRLTVDSPPGRGTRIGADLPT